MILRCFEWLIIWRWNKSLFGQCQRIALGSRQRSLWFIQYGNQLLCTWESWVDLNQSVMYPVDQTLQVQGAVQEWLALASKRLKEPESLCASNSWILHIWSEVRMKSEVPGIYIYICIYEYLPLTSFNSVYDLGWYRHLTGGGELPFSQHSIPPRFCWSVRGTCWLGQLLPDPLILETKVT